MSVALSTRFEVGFALQRFCAGHTTRYTRNVLAKNEWTLIRLSIVQKSRSMLVLTGF